MPIRLIAGNGAVCVYAQHANAGAQFVRLDCGDTAHAGCVEAALDREAMGQGAAACPECGHAIDAGEFNAALHGGGAGDPPHEPLQPDENHDQEEDHPGGDENGNPPPPEADPALPEPPAADGGGAAPEGR